MNFSLSRARRLPKRGRRTAPRPGRRPRFDSLEARSLLAAPFAVGGDPGVDPGDFRVTTFATGLNFPKSMQRSPTARCWSARATPGRRQLLQSTGELVRLVDADGDGQADGPGTVLFSGLPGAVTSVRKAGNLVFVTQLGGGRRADHRPAGRGHAGRPLTLVGGHQLRLPRPTGGTRPTRWPSARPPAGGPPRPLLQHRLVENNADAPPTVPVSGLIAATLNGDSIYKVTVHDGGGDPVVLGPDADRHGPAQRGGHRLPPDDRRPVLRGQRHRRAGRPQRAAQRRRAEPDRRRRHRRRRRGFRLRRRLHRVPHGHEVGSGGIEPLVAFQPIPNPPTARRAKARPRSRSPRPGSPAGSTTASSSASTASSTRAASPTRRTRWSSTTWRPAGISISSATTSRTSATSTACCRRATRCSSPTSPRRGASLRGRRRQGVIYQIRAVPPSMAEVATPMIPPVARPIPWTYSCPRLPSSVPSAGGPSPSRPARHDRRSPSSCRNPRRRCPRARWSGTCSGSRNGPQAHGIDDHLQRRHESGPRLGPGQLRPHRGGSWRGGASAPHRLGELQPEHAVGETPPESAPRIVPTLPAHDPRQFPDRRGRRDGGGSWTATATARRGVISRSASGDPAAFESYRGALARSVVSARTSFSRSLAKSGRTTGESPARTSRRNDRTMAATARPARRRAGGIASRAKTERGD